MTDAMPCVGDTHVDMITIGSPGDQQGVGPTCNNQSSYATARHFNGALLTELAALTRPFAAQYCGDLDSFEQQTLKGDHVLIAMSASNMGEAIKHYKAQKAKHPSTSAVIMVPKWNNWSLARMLKGMQLLREYDRGVALFATTPERSLGPVELPPASAKAQVFYDPPVAYTAPTSAVDASGQPRLTMLFASTVSGVPATTLIDTGATEVAFVSRKWAERANIGVRKHTQTVVLGDGSAAGVHGICSVHVNVGAYCRKLKCLVIDMPDAFDVILGDAWLKKHRAVLMFRESRCVIRCGNRRISLSARVDPEQTDTPGTPVCAAPFLTHMQAKRAIRKDQRTFLVHVQITPDINLAEAKINCEAVRPVLQNHQSVFAKLDGLPPERGDAFYAIPLEEGAQPPFRRMYRLSPREREEVEQQIKDLLAKGFIEPSTSPFGAPILFVQKKDGSLRMCIDYRALNKLTVKNRYPIPRIDDLLDRLHGATMFSSLDLQSGYHQIRIHPNDVVKTAFNTPLGHYQWRVLAFGLTNAPATSQHVMNQVLAPFINKFVVVYLDDILIYSKSEAEHIQHLDQVLAVLKEHQFHVSLHKCCFGAPEVEYLGHIVGRNGLRVDPRKVASVADWPKPDTVPQLHSFLGLANYFRRFVQGYSNLVAPLTSLLRKDAKWVWDDPQKAAFAGVKHALTNAPVLRMPDLEQPFELVADASGFGIGAVLLQHGHPVAFESRKLNTAERNYHTTERELLAVVHALQVWRCYLDSSWGFVCVTDHNPLVWLQTQPNLSPRQTRWSEYLQRFHFRWQYRPGRRNVADPLSRHPTMVSAIAVVTRSKRALKELRTCGDPVGVEDNAAKVGRNVVQPSTTTELSPSDSGILGIKPATPQFCEPEPQAHGVDSGHVQSEGEAGPTRERPRTRRTARVEPEITPELLQAHNEFFQRVKVGYTHDNWFTDENRRGLTAADGLLWKPLPATDVNVRGTTRLLVLPDHDGLRQEVLEELHDAPYSGHLGVTKTTKAVLRLYWWPGVNADVLQFVKSCEACQRNKISTQPPAGLLHPMPIPGRRWESVSLDLVTCMPKTQRGNDTVVVFVDRLSKMVHFHACTQQGTDAVAMAHIFIEQVYRLHGVPKEFVSDIDPRFTGEYWAEVCKLLGTKRALSSSYHPQTDGQTERANRVLEEMLRHYVNPSSMDDWDGVKLALAEFAVNNAWQESVQDTPFRLNYGQHPLTPASVDVDVRVPAAKEFTDGIAQAERRAKTLLQAAQQRQKAYADQGRREASFDVGDEVLLNTKNLRLVNPGSRKLLPKWIGPLTIVSKAGRTQPPPPPDLVDGELEYEVEDIIEYAWKGKGRARKRWYYVKWVGYGPEWNEWIPEENLANSADILQEFWRRTGA
eukprot:jgi/Chrzof1/12845/Cz07g09130.t1